MQLFKKCALVALLLSGTPETQSNEFLRQRYARGLGQDRDRHSQKIDLVMRNNRYHGSDSSDDKSGKNSHKTNHRQRRKGGDDDDNDDDDSGNKSKKKIGSRGPHHNCKRNKRGVLVCYSNRERFSSDDSSDHDTGGSDHDTGGSTDDSSDHDTGGSGNRKKGSKKGSGGSGGGKKGSKKGSTGPNPSPPSPSSPTHPTGGSSPTHPTGGSGSKSKGDDDDDDHDDDDDDDDDDSTGGSKPGDRRKSCLKSGGFVDLDMCCLGADDFPNTCRSGTCSCSSSNSHRVLVCDCPRGECFDGKKCVSNGDNTDDDDDDDDDSSHEPTMEPTVEPTEEEENVRDILEDFYDEMCGSRWVENLGWLDDDISICGWLGIACDDDQKVIGIDMTFNNLSGDCTSGSGLYSNTRLDDIKSLVYIRLGGNADRFGGTGEPAEIPNQRMPDWDYGNLKDLTELTMFGNNLSGNIPSSLGQAKNLQVIGLDINDLTGRISGQTFGGLEYLIKLDLSFNQLQGVVSAGGPICSNTVENGGYLGIFITDCTEVNGQVEVNCACCTDCAETAGNLPA